MGGGAIADYDGLIEVLTARVPEMGLSREGLGYLMGWTPTYPTKVLGPRPSRLLTYNSLFCLLQALGLKMLVVPDPEAEERIKNHSLYEERKFQLSAAENTPIVMRFPRRHYRKIGAKGGKHKRSSKAKRRLGLQAQKGGKARFANMSEQQRSAYCRKIALIRWEQVKAAVRD